MTPTTVLHSAQFGYADARYKTRHDWWNCVTN